MSGFELFVNSRFTENGELVIPKILSTVPEFMTADIYHEGHDAPIAMSDGPSLNVQISVAVRVAINRKSSKSDLKELIR